LDLLLFTPRISIPEFTDWPSNNFPRVMPTGGFRIFPELWRGYGQTLKWEDLKLDLYHGLSHDLPWNWKGNSSATKTIVTIHDLIYVRHPELYPPWDRWTYLQKVRHSCKVADVVIAISEQTRQDLIELVGVPENKITVLYQAVHPRYYRQELLPLPPDLSVTPKKRGPYFLFVGAFEDRKNIMRLIRSFARVQKATDHNLILIGRGALTEKVRNLVEALSMQEFIQVITDVSSESLPCYYQSATALVYPSLFEGFGLPIVEGLMSETLVLTSQGGCFPEAGGAGSFYIDPLSEEAIACGLLEIAGLGPKERILRIHQGLEHVRQFHWRETSAKLYSLYQTVLN
jgi:glycosyltransferase involved in cell wall biosynthesis